jgi:hypothetical protein
VPDAHALLSVPEFVPTLEPAFARQSKLARALFRWLHGTAMRDNGPRALALLEVRPVRRSSSGGKLALRVDDGHGFHEGGNQVEQDVAGVL